MNYGGRWAGKTHPLKSTPKRDVHKRRPAGKMRHILQWPLGTDPVQGAVHWAGGKVMYRADFFLKKECKKVVLQPSTELQGLSKEI